MNLHEIPAFTQNFSIKLICCVPEPVMMLYLTIIKSEIKKKFREKIFSKNHISRFSCSSFPSSGCHGLAVIW